MTLREHGKLMRRCLNAACAPSSMMPRLIRCRLLAQVPKMTPQKHGKLWYDFVVAFARQLLVISAGGEAAAAATERLVS